MEVVERFLTKVRPEESGCLVWTAPLSRSGYGTFYSEGRGRGAHRAAWEIYIGPIPADLVVDHVCRNRACVNVAHLRVVTNEENLNAPGSLVPASLRKPRPRDRESFPDGTDRV